MATFYGKESNPTRCLTQRPTSQSVFFCSRYINLSSMALRTGYSLAYLSYIFSGSRNPSWAAVQKLSEALGMEIGSFVRGLESHVRTQKRYAKKAS